MKQEEFDKLSYEEQLKVMEDIINKDHYKILLDYFGDKFKDKTKNIK